MTAACHAVLALPELLPLISQYLSPKDRSACCSVSRQWYHDWTPLCWNVVSCKYPHPRYRTRDPWDLTRQGHWIRDMSARIKTSPDPECRPLEHIRDHCPNLMSLSVSCFAPLTTAQFQEQILGMTLDNKDTLDPLDQGTPMRGAFLSNSLHSLQLHLWPGVCQLILPALIQARQQGHLQNLRRIQIGQAAIYYTCIDQDPFPPCHITPFTIMTLLETFPDLESFSALDIEIEEDYSEPRTIVTSGIRSLEIHPSSVSILESLLRATPRLYHLRVWVLTEEDHFPTIQRLCPNLTSFTFDAEPRYGAFKDDNHEQQCIDYRSEIELFKSLPGLETVKLRTMYLPFKVMEALVDHCPRLKSFKTCQDSTVSTLGLAYMLHKCSTLTHLDIGGTVQVSLFHGLERWAAPLEQLKMDYMVLKTEADNDAVRNRIQHLPFLKSFEIGTHPGMTRRAFMDPKETLEGLDSKRSFANLRSLVVPMLGDTHLTPLEFREMLKCMPRLIHLELNEVHDAEAIRRFRTSQSLPDVFDTLP